MSSREPLRIKRAVLARPPDGSGHPGPYLQLLLFPEPGSNLFPSTRTRVEFSFHEGLGSEVWLEVTAEERWQRETQATYTIITLRPAHPDPPSLVRALVPKGEFTGEIAAITVCWNEVGPDQAVLQLVPCGHDRCDFAQVQTVGD